MFSRFRSHHSRAAHHSGGAMPPEAAALLLVPVQRFLFSRRAFRRLRWGRLEWRQRSGLVA